MRDFGVSAYKKYLFGFVVENWWYNSTISHLIPVSINFSVSFGYPAIGSADIGISLVIRGHNQGIYTTRSYSDQWTLAHGGVGFNAGASWYDGDLRYFNFEKLYEANAVGWEADLEFRE